MLNALPFTDQQDFADAQRGLIVQSKELSILDANGKVVWDRESYKKFIGLNKAAPASVNPSL